MNDQEFSDVLALGNTLPGPIATKMAGYIGYRVGGIKGMLNAVIATVLPTILLMLLLLTSLNKIKDHPRVEGMTNGVVPIVGVMMATLTWDFIKKTKKGFGWKKGVLLLVGSFIVMEILNVHPGIVIGGLLVIAVTMSDKKEKIEIKVKGNSESL
jgi:chromate transporter